MQASSERRGLLASQCHLASHSGCHDDRPELQAASFGGPCLGGRRSCALRGVSDWLGRWRGRSGPDWGSSYKRPPGADDVPDASYGQHGDPLAKAEMDAVREERASGSQAPVGALGALATPVREERAGSSASAGDVEVDGTDLSTDQLLKMALVKALGSGGKTKKKSKGPGLPLSQSGSDSETETASDPLQKLSGAKGSLLLERLKIAMEQNPSAYIAAIEMLAADSLGEATPNVMTIERFVRDGLPMGHEKSLGYATWGIARAVTLLRSGQSEKAHLVLLLLLASIEQYRLDQNWGAAWKLTQLSMPPFAEWRTKDSMMSQLRADAAHTRLAHPTWCAAVIAKLRDEETLTKRRHGGAGAGQGSNQGERPERPPRGRGRGRSTPESADK